MAGGQYPPGTDVSQVAARLFRPRWDTSLDGGPAPAPPAVLTPRPAAPQPALGGQPARAGHGACRPANRHCWIVDLPGLPSPWPALLLGWRQVHGRWQGRVIFTFEATDASDGQAVLDRWLDARHLRPDGPRPAATS
jgi:hypothetical protein